MPVPVHWVPTPCARGDADEVVWNTTSQALQNLGISQYKVVDYGANKDGAIYRYQLFFTNTRGSGWGFTDEADEQYICSTALDRTHFLQYNSDKPTIKSVTQDV